MERIAYFDCFCGISPKKILGAFLDAGLKGNGLKGELQKLNLKDWKLKVNRVFRGPIYATEVNIIVKDTRSNRPLKEILSLLERSGLNTEVKNLAKSVFLKLASVEAKIHNTRQEDVVFEEVGRLDSILYVVGSCFGLKRLDFSKIFSSPINVGEGFINTNHGTLPLPSPATAELLKSIPIYSKGIRAELTTPTGAALITSFANEFGRMPAMTIKEIGYGAGKGQLRLPNILRIFVGENA